MRFPVQILPLLLNAVAGVATEDTEECQPTIHDELSLMQMKAAVGTRPAGSSRLDDNTEETNPEIPYVFETNLEKNIEAMNDMLDHEKDKKVSLESSAEAEETEERYLNVMTGRQEELAEVRDIAKELERPSATDEMEQKEESLVMGDRPPHFKLLGHFGTGTHLLHALLAKNFKGKATVSDPNENGDYGCTFWKHSNLRLLSKRKPKLLHQCAQPNIIGLAIVRNPLSWMDSVHRSPWDLKNCVWDAKKGKSRPDWLTSPCTYDKTTPVKEMRGKTYRSIPEIWNKWTTDYHELLPSIFHRSMVLTFEDLVLDTKESLNKVARLANLEVPQKVDQVENHVNMLWNGMDIFSMKLNPTELLEDDTAQLEEIVFQGGADGNAAQDGEKPDFHKLEAEKIRKHKYIKLFSEDDLQRACLRLDPSWLKKIGYDDCDDVKISQDRLKRFVKTKMGK